MIETPNNSASGVRRLRSSSPPFGQDGIGTIGTLTTISSTDMAGILMIAVQTLEKRTAEVADLKARLERLEQLVRNRPYVTASAQANE